MISGVIVLPKLPLIEELTTEPLPPGSNIMIQYDTGSSWFNASVTIAAGWLKTGGRCTYLDASQPPDYLRSQLVRLGLNVEDLEEEGRLAIWDIYTATLGRKSKEKNAWSTLKAADLSLRFANYMSRAPVDPLLLRIADDHSLLARFNGDKSWVELMISRHVPIGPKIKSTAIVGYLNGVHSDWLYKQLGAAYDGIVDFKLDESRDPACNLIRIRSMRNVKFNGKWHQLGLGDNFEVTLEK